MSTREQANPLAETVDISAPPERVWDLVSDLTRIAQWSPQVVKTFARGPVKEGSRALNINRAGWKLWPTRSKVVRFEPCREIAFYIPDNGSTWSFQLEPTESGTRVTNRREAPEGFSPVASRFTKTLMGGREAFDAEIREGMQQTLQRLKAEAEG